MTSKNKAIYKTRVGNNAYQIIKKGIGNNKRYHVMRKPVTGKLVPIISTPNFGEACFNLFKDGFSHLPQRVIQKSLEPINKTSL